MKTDDFIDLVIIVRTLQKEKESKKRSKNTEMLDYYTGLLDIVLESMLRDRHRETYNLTK